MCSLVYNSTIFIVPFTSLKSLLVPVTATRCDYKVFCYITTKQSVTVGRLMVWMRWETCSLCFLSADYCVAESTVACVRWCLQLPPSSCLGSTTPSRWSLMYLVEADSFFLEGSWSWLSLGGIVTIVCQTCVKFWPRINNHTSISVITARVRPTVHCKPVQARQGSYAIISMNSMAMLSFKHVFVVSSVDNLMFKHRSCF
jgi:hypothetical protein